MTKPGDRQIPIISGGEHLSKKATKDTGATAAAVTEDKDYSVANAAAGASKTVPIRAGEVRKGGYVMLKGKPCKVCRARVNFTRSALLLKITSVVAFSRMPLFREVTARITAQVVEVSISKTGKHGHAKANITGLDVFTGRKYVEISPTSHNMTAPTMFRSEYEVSRYT